MSKKKDKNIETIVQKEYMQDENETMCGLCIKHNRPTNYSYNKTNPETPYCKTSLSCVYKKYVGNEYYCMYFYEKGKRKCLI